MSCLSGDFQAPDSGYKCVASNMLGLCQGTKFTLNELTAILNTITGQPISGPSGTSGMVTSCMVPTISEKISASERDIIKSRIGIPFWVCERVGLFVKKSAPHGGFKNRTFWRLDYTIRKPDKMTSFQMFLFCVTAKQTSANNSTPPGYSKNIWYSAIIRGLLLKNSPNIR